MNVDSECIHLKHFCSYIFVCVATPQKWWQGNLVHFIRCRALLVVLSCEMGREMEIRQTKSIRLKGRTSARDIVYLYVTFIHWWSFIFYRGFMHL